MTCDHQELANSLDERFQFYLYKSFPREISCWCSTLIIYSSVPCEACMSLLVGVNKRKASDFGTLDEFADMISVVSAYMSDFHLL